MPLKNNSILINRYKILSLLGEGGHSCVYRAKDILTDELCTLKQYLQTSKEFLEQYKFEAEILKSISHRCLTKVLAYFFHENNFILVMEYVDGDDLMKLIRKKGAMSVPQACTVIREVALALLYLHTQFNYPILHRDVKPSNIILKENGEVKLIDFGLVKSDRGQFTATAARSISTGFSPVEQYSQEKKIKTDVRSDIYSLGATFYYLLTGDIPQESIARLWDDNFFADLVEKREIPSLLIAIIEKSMAMVQNDRFSDIQEFIKAIDEFLLSNVSEQDMNENDLQQQNETVEPLVHDDSDFYESDALDFDIYAIDIEEEKELSKRVLIEKDNPDVEILETERSETGSVYIKISLPKSSKEIIIARKSYWKYPKDRFDGDAVNPIISDGVCEVVDFVDSGPVYYTFFRQYKNKRKATITREVVKIDL